MTALQGNPAALAGARIQPLPAWVSNRAMIIEDTFVAGALAIMMLLPIAEMVLRASLEVGIENLNALIQHLALITGTMGAAVAARRNRLLAFAGVNFLPERAARHARFFSNTASAAVCLVLLVSSITFVVTERTANMILAYGIPIWVAQLTLPAAFALLTVRMLTAAAKNTLEVAVRAGTCAVIITCLEFLPPAGTGNVLLLLLVCAAVLGAPVFAVVAGAALVLMWSHGIPLTAVVLDHYSLVSNHLLPSIPLFTLAGYILAESRAPQRLIELFDACFGKLQGGPAFATVLAATFFTCFTGASGVAILALGGLMMPLLRGYGYNKKNALGLITGGGAPGVLLMPALPLILYAIIANITIEQMFLAGLLPALLMFSITVLWGRNHQPAIKSGRSGNFNMQRVLKAIRDAKWELLLPVVLMGGIFSGKATPLEASAITAFYAFLVEVIIHRDLSLRADVPRVLVNCAMLVGGILLILGVALGLTNYMVDAQISETVVEWARRSVVNPWIFLMALNGFLLAAGCFIDIYSAVIVLTPLIVPLGLAYGIHPVHLGIIFLANMELGYLTPPVGLNLFFASSRFERSITEVARSVIPLFCMLALGVLVITYIPWLSTALPGLLR